MTTVCLYLKLHRPFTLKQGDHSYVDNDADFVAVNHLAEECCLKTNEIIYDKLIRGEGKFKISFSVSGVMLELFQQYRPDVIDSFKKLVSTGFVELLAETYYHSLSSLYSPLEFQRQVIKHTETVNRLFGIRPAVFRNTAFIHNNRIARLVADLGMKGILCEGVEPVLMGRSSRRLYQVPGNTEIVLLLRNASLPANASETEIVNLFLDYETFATQKDLLAGDNLIFSTPSEVIGQNYPKDIYDASNILSWECENVMQNNTLKKVYNIEKLVAHAGGNERNTWGRLQTADYFYYMGDGAGKNAHPCFSPKEAFQQYSNILTDFEIRLIKKGLQSNRSNYRELVSI